MNTKIETLIDELCAAIVKSPCMLPDEVVAPINNLIAALRAQADQQTHNVEDSPEYRLGFAAGRESYARHYKCGCTAFPADAPAYCPIHSASQEEQGK